MEILIFLKCLILRIEAVFFSLLLLLLSSLLLSILLLSILLLLLLFIIKLYYLYYMILFDSSVKQDSLQAYYTLKKLKRKQTLL